MDKVKVTCSLSCKRELMVLVNGLLPQGIHLAFIAPFLYGTLERGIQAIYGPKADVLKSDIQDKLG